ncbi:hypothetical protein N7490_003189 [Penicillium lividum]|nr:hypothetical protein N7490_003189 [Penicillium lividum]
MTAPGPYPVGLTEAGESLKANPNEGGTGRMQSGSQPVMLNSSAEKRRERRRITQPHEKLWEASANTRYNQEKRELYSTRWRGS